MSNNKNATQNGREAFANSDKCGKRSKTSVCANCKEEIKREKDCHTTNKGDRLCYGCFIDHCVARQPKILKPLFLIVEALGALESLIRGQ